jgi:hypothetical protein
VYTVSVSGPTVTSTDPDGANLRARSVSQALQDSDRIELLPPQIFPWMQRCSAGLRASAVAGTVWRQCEQK